ncbi:MAG TPA: gluconate:H+ symporter [Pedobacter sp.]|jgi:gluconate transporter
MSLLTVLFGIFILLILVLKKLNPMLALLIVAIITGALLKMPVDVLIKSITSGIGGTLGSLVMVLALGAMIGKLAEESGAALKLVSVLMGWFGQKNIQWAVLLTALLVGIPLFYNAGFVVLIPLVFAIGSATRLPVLYLGLPMAAALSVTHGFLPPHPGPIALVTIFHADVGKVLLYGLALAIPTSIIAGIYLPKLLLKGNNNVNLTSKIVITDKVMPSAFKSFLIALMPIVFITVGTVGGALSPNFGKSFFTFLSDPTFALLLSLIITLIIIDIPLQEAMNHSVEGVKSVAMILLIIAAGGAFKQILIDSGIGETIKEYSALINLSPLFLAWLITAMLRVTLGSATVAALTASGMVLPLIQTGTSPELMVLAVGAGSLMLSHVNDTGFWMFKEYFKLSIKETFKTWTVMESVVSVLGLIGVLLLDRII